MSVFDVKILDAHSHLSGSEYGETPENIVQCLDESGIEKAFIFAPLLNQPSYELRSEHLDHLRTHNDYCADVCSHDPERLLGFCVLNPAPGFAGGDLQQAAKHMIEEAQRCYHDLGLRGVKMIPTGWYPYDRPVIDLYRCIADLGMYVVFHTGIFLNGHEGRYCRPANFEAVHEVKGFKGHLAHVGWPWVEEMLGVMTMMTQNFGQDPNNWDLKVDVSFGAPDALQLETWSKAISVLPPDMLIYGSDLFWPATPEKYKEKVLQPQLGLFEVSATLEHIAQEGSQERMELREKIFFTNAFNHWNNAVREPQQPKRAKKPIKTPSAASDPHGS